MHCQVSDESSAGSGRGRGPAATEVKSAALSAVPQSYVGTSSVDCLESLIRVLSFASDTRFLFGRALTRLVNEYRCHELASAVCN